MFKKAVASIILLSSLMVQAQPELSGTASELEPFLAGIPKTVTFTATAKELLSMNKAVIKLSVETESKRLSDALKENLNIRKSVRDKLESAGIDGSKIKESKFSSTPEYGFFDERPKSFKVENSLSIEIADEAQMIAVALVSDEIEQVHYLGSNAELEDKPESNQELMEKAILLVQNKAELFKSRLGVQLQAVEFREHVNENPVNANENYRRQKVKSLYSSEVNADTSFGHSTHIATVSVTYEVVK
ncbi:MAG: SIMPL domain-containing protein [Aestuariibacter sp.]